MQKGGKGYRIKRAQILLKLDKQPGNEEWTYARIKETYGASYSTIAGVTKRFAIDGVEAALGMKEQKNRYRKAVKQAIHFLQSQGLNVRYPFPTSFLLPRKILFFEVGFCALLRCASYSKIFHTKPPVPARMRSYFKQVIILYPAVPVQKIGDRPPQPPRQTTIGFY